MMKQLFAFSAFVLAGCATPPLPLDPQLAERPTCETSRFSLDAAFAGGAMDACQVVSEDVIEVTIRPEDVPINPSPWYAVRLSADSPTDASITLRYIEHPHRYRPKLSRDGDNWVYVPADKITVSDDGMKVEIEVSIEDSPVFLTGHELITREDNDAWMAKYRGREGFEFSTIGYSIENRSIEMIRTRSGKGNGSVILTGRQHPPELSGALAHYAFVDEVLGDSELANRFREEFELAIIPFMNPDGVFHGHWRHNLSGVDLNRDWGPFEQPETRAVRDVIDELAADPATSPVIFMDFHSTRRDVFYTQFTGEDGSDYGFTAKWLERAGARLPDYVVERAERHQSDLPTSKNYMHGRFGIPAITYELGDETDRELVSRSAKVFAQEMMAILLEYELDQ